METDYAEQDERLEFELILAINEKGLSRVTSALARAVKRFTETPLGLKTNVETWTEEPAEINQIIEEIEQIAYNLENNRYR